MSGKCPISNKLLKSIEREKETGVEIIWINLPGMPQYEKCDFLIFRIILATSMGEVFNILKVAAPSFLCKFGIVSYKFCTGSSGFVTVDFDAK